MLYIIYDIILYHLILYLAQRLICSLKACSDTAEYLQMHMRNYAEIEGWQAGGHSPMIDNSSSI